MAPENSHLCVWPFCWRQHNDPCEALNHGILNHFVNINKMVDMGSYSQYVMFPRLNHSQMRSCYEKRHNYPTPQKFWRLRPADWRRGVLACPWLILSDISPRKNPKCTYHSSTDNAGPSKTAILPRPTNGNRFSSDATTVTAVANSYSEFPEYAIITARW